jgi:hypothetical protein
MLSSLDRVATMMTGVLRYRVAARTITTKRSIITHDTAVLAAGARRAMPLHTIKLVRHGESLANIGQARPQEIGDYSIPLSPRYEPNSLVYLLCRGWLIG